MAFVSGPCDSEDMTISIFPRVESWHSEYLLDFIFYTTSCEGLTLFKNWLGVRLNTIKFQDNLVILDVGGLDGNAP